MWGRPASRAALERLAPSSTMKRAPSDPGSSATIGGFRSTAWSRKPRTRGSSRWGSCRSWGTSASTGRKRRSGRRKSSERAGRIAAALYYRARVPWDGRGWTPEAEPSGHAGAKLSRVGFPMSPAAGFSGSIARSLVRSVSTAPTPGASGSSSGWPARRGPHPYPEGADRMLRKAIAGLALAALMSSPAAAQTVDEVLASHIKAKGGMEKIKSINSMKVTGKMVMGQGMEAPFTMFGKRPKSTRMEFAFQGMTGIQAYDGKNAWMVMPFMGKKDPEMLAAEETKMMDEQADLDGPLVDSKDKGHTVELVGKEKVEGADVYKLKVT